MNNNYMQEIFRKIVRYNDVNEEEALEIVSVLEKFDYVIDDDNFTDFNNMLIYLDDKQINLDKILKRLNENDFESMNKYIFFKIEKIYSDENDKFFLDYQHLFSNEQREKIYNTLIEKCNGEKYIYNRLIVIFNYLIKCEKNNDILINTIKFLLNQNLLNDSQILKEVDGILKISSKIITDDIVNLYIEKILEICTPDLCDYLFSKVKKYKNRISISNLKKMDSYVKNFINCKNYNDIFLIYKDNIGEMLNDENAYLQLKSFLIDYIDISNNLSETLELLEQNYDQLDIDDIIDLISKYFDCNFEYNENLNKQFSLVINDYYNNTASKNDLLDKLFSKDIFPKYEINKINKILFKNISLELDDFINSYILIDCESTDIQKINKLLFLIENKLVDSIIDYVSILFNDTSNEKLIKEILKHLNDSKIKFKGKNNNKLWELMNEIIESTSSESLSTEVNNTMLILKLHQKKDKKRISAKC